MRVTFVHDQSIAENFMRYLTIGLLMFACGCGPLRPFEVATTGGRTALTQWEYQEAISRIYQTQVLLNLIRMVEYGESPVHFEFSDITATIDDDAGVNLSLGFDDAPSGRVTIGSVSVPNVENPVSIMPSTSASRSVQLVAKVSPVVGKNWVYDWYYAIGNQFIRDPDLRWYREVTTADDPSCANFRLASDGSDITVSYRLRTYQLRSSAPANNEVFVSARECFSPPRELGALTTILSLLSSSRPDGEASQIPVEQLKSTGASSTYTFHLAVPDKTDPVYDDNLKQLGFYLMGKDVRVLVPQGAGNVPSEVRAKITRTASTYKLDQSLQLITEDDTGKGDRILDRYLAALAGKDPPKGTLVIEFTPGLVVPDRESLLLPSDRVAGLAKRRVPPGEKLEKQLLQEIVDEIRRLTATRGG